VVLVLGLTGANAAGKGEVASYLRDRGFAVHSLSDVIRD
jgi:dephospho-CoA kinase